MTYVLDISTEQPWAKCGFLVLKCVSEAEELNPELYLILINFIKLQ